MTTFDKFYAWAYPHIPSRDKIYAKLVELKVEQDTSCQRCEYGPAAEDKACAGCCEAYTSEFKPKEIKQ